MKVILNRILPIICTSAFTIGCWMSDGDPQSSDQTGQVKRVETSESINDTGLLNHWLGLNANGHSTNGISVNGFLWRATLDTISFMPLAQADPFGGIILTDWYRPPETQDERFKINVYILDSKLRADGLRVSVFRQHRDKRGVWLDKTVNSNTGTNLENAILKRARQMRLNTEQ